jgi:type II secretory pathway pseudopilin PulG
MFNIKRFAFTLAEILIVIGILGIVAEMTIPDLVTNVQSQTYITSLQRAYNEINSTINQIATDGGCIEDLGCSGIYGVGTDPTSVGHAFEQYFKVSKDCGISSQNCWPNQTNINYDGSSISHDNYNTNGYYTFVTADGMSFALNANYLPANGCGGGSSYCGFIVVDTNGPKGPNTYGRDTFIFIAYLKPYSWIKRMLMAYGEQGTNPWNLGGANHCSPTDKTGYYCPGRILEKGWTMDY